jgi:hypothetical protein
MYMEQNTPLSKQLELVFRALKDELASLASGTIILQIRNNLIGKFGVKHDPITSDDDESLPVVSAYQGLQEHHQAALRQAGLRSLERKKWTHGEVMLGFVLKNGSLLANIQVESNYNMNNLLSRS